jgi:peroxiredoxin
MLLAFGLLVACVAAGKAPPSVGSQAPDFTLEAARGGSFRLQDLQGKAVLVSFLNTQATATDMPDPSRSQIVFLKSMLEQYGANGLAILIVDAARIQTGEQPTLDSLINFTYDWQLDMIPVLIDPDGDAASLYGISDTPTTFLVDIDGIIQQRWDGSATASQLAFAIEALIGAPAFRVTSATTTVINAPCPGETPAQARFAGVGLARSLSNELWLIDGGQAWSSGGGYPLQWIIVDDQNLAGGQDLLLVVTAQYPGSTESLELVNLSLAPLPADEMRGLLVGETGEVSNVYLLPMTISLARPGCLTVYASVFREGSSWVIYSGQAIVTVR